MLSGRFIVQIQRLPSKLRFRTSLGATVRWHGGSVVSNDEKKVNITFIQPDGETRTQVQAIVGETLLRTAHRNEIDLEGACEGGT